MNTKTHKIHVDGMELIISDVDVSETMIHMREQVFDQDEYGIRKMCFNEGDVVVDIGANIGCVSLWLAKKYPFLTIYAYEAHPTNYSNLINNIQANGIKNIVARNLVVHSTDDVPMKITLNTKNTGSSSIFKVDKNSNNTATVQSISLDSIISQNKIFRIKFLKLDCEGAEFDILQKSDIIHKIPVEHVAVEIHTFAATIEKTPTGLVSLIKKISINPPICKVYSLG